MDIARRDGETTLELEPPLLESVGRLALESGQLRRDLAEAAPRSRWAALARDCLGRAESGIAALARPGVRARARLDWGGVVSIVNRAWVDALAAEMRALHGLAAGR